MIKIVFICHGNICRSPMAEMVFKNMVREKGMEDKVQVCSMATSTEELGSDVHRGTRLVLMEHGIPCKSRRAVQIKRSDYDKYDYLVCMDGYNVYNLTRIIGEDRDNKISLLLDYTHRKGEIADPWYTGDFEITYNDVEEGCKGLMEHILNRNTKL